MELWPRRRAQWLNIWAGTGVGYTFAKGNEYGMYFSNTKTQDGTTTPFVDGESVSNDDTITITGVQTKNRHEKFNTLYIPASLHIEADVSRRFTIGLKGEMDWLLNRKDIAPKNLVFALATVRYNFVPNRARAQRACYEGAIATLGDRVNALQREASEAKAQADKAENARRQAEQQNADLQRRLQDCENSKPTAATAAAACVARNSRSWPRPAHPAATVITSNSPSVASAAWWKFSSRKASPSKTCIPRQPSASNRASRRQKGAE